MAKAKTKTGKKKIYIWTHRAAAVFGSRVEPGKQAHFLGHPVTEDNLPLSWLACGYVEEGSEEDGQNS